MIYSICNEYFTVNTESEITFLSVEKQRECLKSRPALKEMLKEIIQWRGNDIRRKCGISGMKGKQQK